MLAKLITAYPCESCGVKVRLVVLTNERKVVINAQPDPDGRIIPWPNDKPTGIVMGRVVDSLMSDEQGYSQHRCP